MNYETWMEEFKDRHQALGADRFAEISDRQDRGGT